MDMLLKYGPYLTLEEARACLSESVGRSVQLSKVYELVMRGSLTMSAKFNSVIEMSPGYEFSEPNVPYYADESNSFPTGLGRKVCFEESIMTSEGVWDLTMRGREFMDIEALYQTEVGREAWQASAIDAVILKKNDIFCRLKGLKTNIDSGPHVIPEKAIHTKDEEKTDCLSLNYYAHELVIRTKELIRFIKSLEDELVPPPSEKPLLSKERNTLLKLIRALCLQLGIDPTEYGAATPLVEATELAGTPLSNEAIRKIILKIKKL